MRRVQSGNASIAPGAEKSTLLLEKILVVQLHSLGVPQGVIAKMVGRQVLWVNAFLKGIPKRKT